MRSQSTIRVERMAGRPAIKMAWEQRVNVEDVGPAFQAIVRLIEEAGEPLSVIVDITSRPLFPLSETMTQALVGPQQHPLLHEWLVVGATSQATIIEEFLTKVSGRANVRWFRCEQAALNHLDAQSANR